MLPKGTAEDEGEQRDGIRRGDRRPTTCNRGVWFRPPKLTQVVQSIVHSGGCMRIARRETAREKIRILQSGIGVMQ